MAVIDKRITLNAPREVVWQYLEDPNRLAAWLMRNNFTPRTGTEFQFFGPPQDSWDGVISCRLIEFDPPNRMAFTWNANDIGTDTLVTIELVERGEQTELRLLHANFEDAVTDAEALIRKHADGWADHLNVLRGQVAEEARGGQETHARIDWTAFDLHVAIDAAPEHILHCWATSGGMESFFVEMMQVAGPDGVLRAADEAAQPGDRYVWRWHNGRSLDGAFLAPEADNQVRFTFGDSRVTVTAHRYGNGSLVHLRQSDIPDTDHERMQVHANCRGGWIYFLTVLKILLEFGVDGRDRTRETGASFSTYFDPSQLNLSP